MKVQIFYIFHFLEFFMISLLSFGTKLKSTDFICNNLFSIYNQYLYHLFECIDRYIHISRIKNPLRILYFVA